MGNSFHCAGYFMELEKGILYPSNDDVEKRRYYMLPDRETAMKILESSYLMNPGPWKAHSIVTAECAYKIAKCCSDMDEEKAYILGLLHDIGRRFGVTHLKHVIDGYRFFMEMGYDEAARACLTHSFSMKTLDEYIGKRDVSGEESDLIRRLLAEYEYNDYDRLVQLCDSIAMPDGPVDIEIRMQDVKDRYGEYPIDKWNKNIELQGYFEQKAGKRLEQILTEMVGGIG